MALSNHWNVIGEDIKYLLLTLNCLFLFSTIICSFELDIILAVQQHFGNTNTVLNFLFLKERSSEMHVHYYDLNQIPPLLGMLTTELSCSHELGQKVYALPLCLREIAYVRVNLSVLLALSVSSYNASRLYFCGRIF